MGTILCPILGLDVMSIVVCYMFAYHTAASCMCTQRSWEFSWFCRTCFNFAVFLAHIHIILGFFISFLQNFQNFWIHSHVCMPYCKKLFWNGSKSVSVKCGGEKTNELLCNESCRINTGAMEDSVIQDTHSYVHAVNHTTDLHSQILITSGTRQPMY